MISYLMIEAASALLVYRNSINFSISPFQNVMATNNFFHNRSVVIILSRLIRFL